MKLKNQLFYNISNLNKNIFSIIPKLNFTVRSFFTISNIQNENWYKNKNKLPLYPREVAKMFIEDKPDIKYCETYNKFFLYNTLTHTWFSIEKDDVKDLLFGYLEFNSPNDYKNLSLNEKKNIFKFVKLELELENFSMPDAIKKANKNGYLLPFLNGVLNTKTFEFVSHDPNYFIKFLIPLKYSKEDLIEKTKFYDFLNSITNNNPMRLKVLRACLHLIFTNKINSQLALYIYGPDYTGKTILIKILEYLLRGGAISSYTVPKITTKFRTSDIVGKILLILKEVSTYKLKEARIIKKIIEQKEMESRETYEKSFMFNPSTFVILNSDNLWDVNNVTKGLDWDWRVIYFPLENLKNNLNNELELFNTSYNENFEITGSLVPYLSGFINWILNCPQEDLNLLNQRGEDITEIINSEFKQLYPLKRFIRNCVRQHPNPNHCVEIGNKDSKFDTLYGCYLVWAKQKENNILNLNQFTKLFLNTLTQQGWKVSTEKKSIGNIFKGIQLHLNSIQEMKK